MCLLFLFWLYEAFLLIFATHLVIAYTRLCNLRNGLVTLHKAQAPYTFEFQQVSIVNLITIYLQ